MSAGRTASLAPRFSHVIFDVDGLLLDTERIYSEVCAEICQEYGHEFTWEVKVKQMGKIERDSTQVLIDCFNLPLSCDDLIAKMHVMLEQKLPYTEVLPGAEKLVRHLHKHKVPLALASGSDSWSFSMKISNCKELFSLFHHAVLSSDDPDVKQGKPSPECYLVCARRFGEELNLNEVLVFEDAHNGVQAGLSAGMHVVWVPDVRADRKSLEGQVDIVLDSLENFIPEDFGFPPYDRS